MQKIKKNKGFTLVELAIVIAVIAILIAVLVPTFISLINKANESADKQTVKNLNTALSTDEAINGRPANINEVLAVTEAAGYKVENLTPTSEGCLIVWNETDNRFEYVEADALTTTYSSNQSTIWLITGSYNSTYADFSQYISGTITEDLTVSAGISVGSNSDINISYTDTAEESVTFVTNGGTLTVDNENATVNHYGTAITVNVTNVDLTASYHVYGKVTGNINVAAGHVVIESGSEAQNLYVTGESVTIQNNCANTVYAVPATQAVAEKISAMVQGGNVEVSTSVIAASTLQYFAGGFGTQASPYLISTAQQFTNIYYISLNYSSYGYNAENKVYYKLTNDIELSTGIIYEQKAHNDMYCFGGSLYYAVFDGDGYTLDATYVNPEYDAAKNYDNQTFHYDLFYIMNNSDLKNVTVNMGGNAEGIAAYAHNTTTFTKVDVTGSIEFWNENLAAYVGYAFNGTGSTGNLTFTDCTNYATLTSSGDYYNAVFVGWVTDNGGGTNGINVYLTFDNCVNAGNFTGYKAAMFVANSTDNGYKGIQELTITNCKNTGTIRSTCVSSYDPNFYIAQGSMSGELTIDGTEYTLSTVPMLNNVYQGPNDTVSIYLDGGCYAITKSSISGASTYTISVGLYTVLCDGTGTGSYFVTLTVNVSDFGEDGTYTSNLQDLQFMDLATYKEKTGSDFSYTSDTDTIKAIDGGTGYMVEVSGDWYYIIDNKDYELSNGIASATRITVSVRDDSNTLLSSATI